MKSQASRFAYRESTQTPSGGSPSRTHHRHPGRIFDAGLIELLNLRASQINGCLLCLRHYIRLAIKADVPLIKAENVETWRRTDVFSPSEKAALSWVEQLAGTVESAADSMCASLKDYFSDAQIAELFEYWKHSEFWSGNGVIRCCAGAQAAPRSRNQTMSATTRTIGE